MKESGHIVTYKDKDGEECFGLVFYSDQSKKTIKHGHVFIRCTNKGMEQLLDGMGKIRVVIRPANEAKVIGYIN